MLLPLLACAIGVDVAADRSPEEIAASAYAFLVKNEPSAEGYERAELRLASALLDLDLRVAAGEYLFNVARNRTNPELLADALYAIRALMAGPHDENLFERHLLAESELGRFPPELDAFLSYTKGLEDLRIHHVGWGERHFARIDRSTPYQPRAFYALGVQRLRRGEKKEAVALIRRALAHPAADRDLRNQSRLALARVLFEEGRFEGALDLYRRVELDDASEADPTLHLEKAWAHYHLGNFREAMGGLFALEAPSYRSFHAPEIYLLRALVYKQLCRFIQSKRVVRSFHRRFEETLRNIHERAELREDPVLRAAAMQRGRLKRVAAFRDAIRQESERLEELGADSALGRHLAGVYALKGRQVDLEMQGLLEEQAQEVAEELIDFEEQMQLLDYELGLAIHQRARAPMEELREQLPDDQERTAQFRFADEFWNDELDKYRFVLEDRCVRRGAGE